jgi:LPS O-antigen subunit length determinant protein (WzzB/FepE family)
LSVPPAETDRQSRQSSPGIDDRFVYVLPEHFLSASNNDAMDLKMGLDILWRGKWIVILTTIIFAVASVTYALLATEWYRAQALLAPANENTIPSIGGQLGGLAMLAGVSVGGENSAEAVAILKSRQFASAFIEELDLLPVFFAADWDADRNQWLAEDSTKWPDLHDGIKYFHDHVLRVGENRTTGFVTLAIEWTDAETAALWTGLLVTRLNERLRERALREAESNVAFLQAELQNTNVIALQQAIGRMLESELQKLMLARGNEDFAFRTIDAPSAPKDRVRPNRAILSVVGTILGGMIGIFLVFLVHLIVPRPSTR